MLLGQGKVPDAGRAPTTLALEAPAISV